LKNNLIYIVILSLVMFSCEFFKMKNSETEITVEKTPIARAHDVFLYPEDLEGIAPTGMSIEDSTDRVKRYIDNWAKKQLLIKEASGKIDFDEADIERKILDYRYSLMGYEYQSYYINAHLDKEVTDEEVLAYYEDNIDNFILKQNIIRGKFISIPNEAPKTEDLNKLMVSSKEEELERLTAYCLSYATAYQINDTVWINFEELISGTPLVGVPNKVQFLKQTKFTEVSDSLNTYYLKLDEYKISDEISPMEFVKDQVKDILINKRKIELAKQLEQQVYNKAIENNEVEIF